MPFEFQKDIKAFSWPLLAFEEITSPYAGYDDRALHLSFDVADIFSLQRRMCHEFLTCKL